MRKDAPPPTKGSKVLGALTEFRDALKEGVRIEDHFTVRTVELDLHPKRLSPEQVKQVRKQLSLSQPLFARFLGVDVKTVRAWEQGLRTPSPIACRFMGEIACSPDYWRERLRGMITSRESARA